jgi:integrase
MQFDQIGWGSGPRVPGRPPSRAVWYAIYRPGALGGYLDGSALRRRYLEALDRAGSRRLRSHDERHTFATAMIANRAILSAHNSGAASESPAVESVL